MEFRPRKRNTPIAILLRNYENKQSKRVVESRKEIQWRFENLDWKDQKKIIKAFLASGKSDREWAARQLISFWDSSFGPIIKKMWEETREEILEWSIIRYFPIDYLKSNIDRLGTGRSYYFLCLRLINEEDFEIDESRLRETDLLNLYCNSSRILSKEKAIECLFTIVYKICREKYSYQMNNLWPDGIERGYMVSILHHGVMREALNDLMRLKMYDVIEEFISWHMDVCESLLNSEEFAQLYAGKIDNSDYNRRRIVLTKKYYYEHLDRRYILDGEYPAFTLEFYYIKCDDDYFVPPDIFLCFDVDKDELIHYGKIRERAMERLNIDVRASYKCVYVRIALKRMMKKNPAISELMDKFDLYTPF